MILATFLQNVGRWGLLMALLLGPNPGLAGTRFSSPTMTATLTTPGPRPNLALLKTALAKFFQSTAFRTESTLVITTTTAQVNVNFKSQTETLTVLPRNFRSRLQLGSKNYELISNGQQVWVLDLDKKQYSMLSFQQFQASDDSFLIGLGASFLLEMAGTATAASLTDPQAWLPTLIDFFVKDYVQEGMTLSQSQVLQSGTAYHQYQYQLPQENLALVLWIDEQSQTLAKLQILGQEDDLAINIEETIHRHQSNPGIPPDAFQFRPSPLFTRVEDVPLDPF
jgi:outer membrane lipoprotein-sorting protein